MAKTKSTPPVETVWAAGMDYTGVYGPFQATVVKSKLAVEFGDKQKLTVPKGTRGLKWFGDGHRMACVYLAETKSEVATWVKGVNATHRMMRSSMRKGR